MVSNTGGLCALIESRYLDREVTGYSRCSIQVNPIHAYYVTDRTIIINAPGYPEENIKLLLENGNIVISRIPCDIPGVLYRPYLPRLCSTIMWSGSYVESLDDKDDPESIEYYFKDNILYIPKAKTYSYTKGSYLEFMAYQAGINVYSPDDCKFNDLDIIKTGKGIFPEKIEKRRFRRP